MGGERETIWAASGNSLDSGEWTDGQPLLEGCTEAVSSGESQVWGRWEVKKILSLQTAGEPALWQGVVWWGEGLEAQEAPGTGRGTFGQTRHRLPSDVPGPRPVLHPAWFFLPLSSRFPMLSHPSPSESIPENNRNAFPLRPDGLQSHLPSRHRPILAREQRGHWAEGPAADMVGF